MTKIDEVVAAIESLTELGYLELSGEHRPDRTGKMQPVYRVSVLGHAAQEYLDHGFSFEEAMALTRASASVRVPTAKPH